MAEVPEPEAAGSNRRVLVVCLVVALIVVYLIVKSIYKKDVIAGLESQDAAVRKSSTEKLVEWKILADVMGRESVPVKRPMIATLREMKNDAAADQLILLMADRNPTVQNEAQFALVAMQPSSIAKLVTALGNADLNVKNRAAAALIAIGQPVLKPVKDAKGVESLPLITAIDTATAAARPGVTRVAVALHGGASWLLKELADAKADAATKACAIDILGRLNAQEAAKPIRDALNAKKADPAVQRAALVALARLRQPDAFGLLDKALSDPVTATVNTAIVGLGELQDPRAVGLLQEHLKSFDEDLRDAAVAALAKIGSPAVPALTALLKDPRWEVRVGALGALQAISDPRAPGIIALALKDSDENVRRAAAGALGQPGRSIGIAPLVGALGDPAWRVAVQARDSLAEIGPSAIPALVGVLSQDPRSTSSYYAQGALERIGAASVPALMAAASAGNEQSRQRAVLALGTIGDQRALRLLESLTNGGQSGPIRNAAERALKQVKEGRRVS